jgi:hypothetical protein
MEPGAHDGLGGLRFAALLGAQLVSLLAGGLKEAWRDN